MAVVAVLGGGGFIGSNLVRRLVRDGHLVQAVDIDFPAGRANPHATLIGADLRIPEQAAAAVAGCKWVFHLAADMGGVGYFHSDADWGAATRNGRITLNVLEACAAEGVERMFYAASACAYPTELMMTAGRAPVLTEDLIGHGTPDALYGAEKLHGLRLCSKLPFARVGVLDTVYGPLQERDGRRAKFPAAVASKALRARETGLLELWGDGEQLRSYLYVDDAIDRIIRVMEADHYDGPVNIAAGQTVTCREIAQICLNHVGAPDARIVTNPAEPSGVLARHCSSAKFERVYGPVRERGYEEGFGQFIDSIDQDRHEDATASRGG